jgi:hypothetical protein
MGELIRLPVAEKPDGNGAHEALSAIADLVPSVFAADPPRWADYILLELYERGFKVVPLD